MLLSARVPQQHHKNIFQLTNLYVNSQLDCPLLNETYSFMQDLYQLLIPQWTQLERDLMADHAGTSPNDHHRTYGTQIVFSSPPEVPHPFLGHPQPQLFSAVTRICGPLQPAPMPSGRLATLLLWTRIDL